MSRPESDRCYRTGVLILLSVILILGFPLSGLAQPAPSDLLLSPVYLPLLFRHVPFVASSGTLDPSFDQDGLVLTGLSAGDDFGIALAVLRDGKLLVGGEVSSDYDMDLAVARYNPDGSLDITFGSAGWTRTDLDGLDDYAAGIAVQLDGKILLAGTSRNDFALVRYNPDGSLDTTFSGDGWVRTDFLGSADEAKAVAIQPDGRIIVAGYAMNGTHYDFALLRYLANGSLDTSFGVGGKVTTDLTGDQDQIKAIAIQPDGKIVAVGPVKNGSRLHDFAVARYNSNGTLDTSFGVGGWVATDYFGGQDFAYAVALQTDGKIVVAGAADIADDLAAFAVARYTAGGNLDITFSGDGRLITDFSVDNDYAYSVCLQPDGKIIAAGYAYNGTNDDFALARYNPNGSPDTSFSEDGSIVTDLATGEDKGLAVILQVDGKIVVAGSGFNGSDADFALVRYK
jgi:uncharacterized delta-60 repeat protein